MSFRFESARARWGVEDYLDALRRSNPRYAYGSTPGRGYLKLWYHHAGTSADDRSVFAFADARGNVYRADSARKRGRLLGRAEEMARRPVGGSSPSPRVVGDARRRRHRSPNAPTFAKQRFISRKIRILRHEGYPPKQAEAIAYRYAGVPRRKARRRSRR